MDWRLRAGIATLVAAALVGGTGCGGEGDSGAEPAAETGEPAVQPATEPDSEKALQELEQPVEEQGYEGQGKSKSGAKDSGDVGLTHCGGGLSAGPNTSCPFAQEVRWAYESSGGREHISAYSPVTGQTYRMDCTPGADVATVCTGGNNATVYFN
jgi:hypothetical protein